MKLQPKASIGAYKYPDLRQKSLAITANNTIATQNPYIALVSNNGVVNAGYNPKHSRKIATILAIPVTIVAILFCFVFLYIVMKNKQIIEAIKISHRTLKSDLIIE